MNKQYPGTVVTMFQSLAGTDSCNKTFDVTIEKIMKYARGKKGERYGLYFETGQGTEFTNGEAHGVDMMVHESRKYGFSRAVQMELAKVQPMGAWLHVNDVAGFIGPEVFKSREQWYTFWNAGDTPRAQPVHNLCGLGAVAAAEHVDRHARGHPVDEIPVGNAGVRLGKEYRRDPEDLKGWFPLHRYAGLVFATDADALESAKASVEWLATH